MRHQQSKLVADEVAVSIIEELEVVQIQHRHGQRSVPGTVRFHLPDGVFQTCMKCPVIEQPRQRVPLGLLPRVVSSARRPSVMS